MGQCAQEAGLSRSHCCCSPAAVPTVSAIPTVDSGRWQPLHVPGESHSRRWGSIRPIQSPRRTNQASPKPTSSTTTRHAVAVQKSLRLPLQQFPFCASTAQQHSSAPAPQESGRRAFPEVSPEGGINPLAPTIASLAASVPSASPRLSRKPRAVKSDYRFSILSLCFCDFATRLSLPAKFPSRSRSCQLTAPGYQEERNLNGPCNRYPLSTAASSSFFFILPRGCQLYRKAGTSFPRLYSSDSCFFCLPSPPNPPPFFSTICDCTASLAC